MQRAFFFFFFFFLILPYFVICIAYKTSLFKVYFRSVWIPLITKNWKNYNKIIFKGMNSAVELSFKVIFVFFLYWRVPWTMHETNKKKKQTHWKCTNKHQRVYLVECPFENNLFRFLLKILCLKYTKVYLYFEKILKCEKKLKKVRF